MAAYLNFQLFSFRNILIELHVKLTTWEAIIQMLRFPNRWKNTDKMIILSLVKRNRATRRVPKTNTQFYSIFLRMHLYFHRFLMILSLMSLKFDVSIISMIWKWVFERPHFYWTPIQPGQKARILHSCWKRYLWMPRKWKMIQHLKTSRTFAHLSFRPHKRGRQKVKWAIRPISENSSNAVAPTRNMNRWYFAWNV